MTSTGRRWFIKSTVAGAATTLLGCDKSSTKNHVEERQTRPLSRIAGFGGRVIEKTDAVYEEWRRGMVWQSRKPERFPAFILRPNDDNDVAAALQFAKTEGLRVSVRSGGHHVWGASLRNDGILLDLANFKQLIVDKSGGTAKIGPSLWASDVMAGLADQKLGFPVAHCATVPLGGYALGGGLGINGDEWGGMACNNILGGRLVTADGAILDIDEKSHADLLWAMRGGGGALPGIVTEFNVKTFYRPAQVFSSTYVFPLAMLDAALDLLDGIVDIQPRNTELLALMLHNPQAPPDAPAEMKKAIAVRAQVYVDDMETAQPVLDAIGALPAAAQSVFSLPAIPESFEQLFSGSMDWRRGFGFGRFAVENAWCEDRRSAVQAIAKIYIDAPFWKSHVVIQPKLANAVDGHGAFSIAADTFIGLYSVWDDSGADDTNIRWLRQMSAALDEHSVGHYINEIDAFTNADRVARCFSESSFVELQALRSKWDPGNRIVGFPGSS